MSLIAVLVTLLAAGCGSSSNTSGPDPASAVPASVPLYIGVVIRPQGDLKQAAVLDAQKVSRLQNPYEKLLEGIQGEGGKHVKWSELKSWIGDRVGLFLQSIGGSGSPLSLLEEGVSGSAAPDVQRAVDQDQTSGALVLSITDSAQARSFLARQTTSPTHSSTYRGVTYQVSDDEHQAFGIVGQFAVIGDERGLKSVIDTLQSHDSLASTANYAQLSAKAEGQALANAYIDARELLGSTHAGSKQEADGLALLDQLLSATGPVYLSLIPTDRAITIESLDVPRDTQAERSAETQGGQMFSQLPANSWLAIGIGDIGRSLKSSAKSLQSLSDLGTSNPFGQALPKLQTKGIDLERDFFSWMGSAGIFAAGSSLLNITAAIEITTTNQSRADTAVAKMATLLSGSGATVHPVSIAGADEAVAIQLKDSPLTIDVASGHGKFVIGLGEPSIEQAFEPSGTLAGAPTYKAAEQALGGAIKPVLLLDFPTLLSFVEGLSLGEDESLGKVLPYLRSLGTLSAGSERVEHIRRSRVVLSLL